MSVHGHRNTIANNKDQGKTEDDLNSVLSFTVDFNQRRDSSSFKSVESFPRIMRNASKQQLSHSPFR